MATGTPTPPTPKKRNVMALCDELHFNNTTEALQWAEAQGFTHKKGALGGHFFFDPKTNKTHTGINIRTFLKQERGWKKSLFTTKRDFVFYLMY